MGVCVDCSAITEGKAQRCSGCKLVRDAKRKAEHRGINKDDWDTKRKKYYEDNKEKIREATKQYATENPERCRLYRKTAYIKNIKSIKENAKEYYCENKERMLESNRQWNKDNPHKRKAIGAKYRAASLQANVPWANHEAIALVYKECLETTERTGVLHHVDHIVPLQSDLVCGLHCEFNLRVIPAKENLTKSNKFEVV
jgi:hypothetical protein